MLSDTLEKILPRVEKPARYTGGEYNMVMKDVRETDVRFALAFPDTYEVGMSHLGSKILYDVINRREDCFCERTFTPWVDMERELRANSLPLFTLETLTPLGNFDIIGFSLHYELGYTNVLNMLELARIPLLSAERNEEQPLVIAGGMCAFNPEPLTPFIDAFVIGEGEEVTGELIDAYKEGRDEGREALLGRLAKIEGVYVPSLYAQHVKEDGTLLPMTVKEGALPQVRKRIVADMDEAPCPEAPIVPYVSIVHDRMMIEVFRGCTRGCRFCQAGMLTRPVRERSAEKVVEIACAQASSTGYEELSLSSLSTGDYTQLETVERMLNERLASKRVSISLPSLRLDSFTKEMAEATGKVRRGSLTFAPEAGSQRLRNVINKNVTEEDLLRTMGIAFESGYNSVKLYFMIGLPTETMQDLEELASLVNKVADVYYALDKKKRAPRLRITVSTAVFVPKAHTPFQWCAQDDTETIMQKVHYLKGALNRRCITYNWHKPQTSRLEAAFALGDRRLADVLYRAFQSGCRLDGWDEFFNYEKWLAAFEEAGLDLAFFANRARGPEEVLPWDHIDCGVSKRYLLCEWQAAQKEMTTPDCREGCTGCGAAMFGVGGCV